MTTSEFVERRIVEGAATLRNVDHTPGGHRFGGYGARGLGRKGRASGSEGFAELMTKHDIARVRTVSRIWYSVAAIQAAGLLLEADA